MPRLGGSKKYHGSRHQSRLVRESEKIRRKSRKKTRRNRGCRRYEDDSDSESSASFSESSSSDEDEFVRFNDDSSDLSEAEDEQEEKRSSDEETEEKEDDEDQVERLLAITERDAKMNIKTVAQINKLNRHELEENRDENGRSILQQAILQDNLTVAREILYRVLVEPVDRKRRREMVLLRQIQFESERQCLFTNKTKCKKEHEARVLALEQSLARIGMEAFIKLISNTDKDGWTTLHYASQAEPGAMRLLLDYVPRIEHFKKHELRVAKEQLRNMASAQDSTGCTPLHIAAINGNLDAISCLKKWNACKGIQNFDEETAIDLAINRATRMALFDGEIARACSGDNIAFRSVKFVLDCGEDVDERKGLLQQSALHRACESGSINVAEYLIEEAGADVNLPDASLWTPLHYCAKYSTKRHRLIATILMSRGAIVDAQTNNKLTPLMIAASSHEQTGGSWSHEKARRRRSSSISQIRDNTESSSHRAMIGLLISFGANIEITETHSRTAFLLAAKHGNLRTAFELIESGCDLYTTDSKGWNCLHHACFQGHLDLIRLFCYVDGESFKLKNMRNRAGKTPHDICRDQRMRRYIGSIWEFASQGKLDKLRKVIRDFRNQDLEFEEEEEEQQQQPQPTEEEGIFNNNNNDDIFEKIGKQFKSKEYVWRKTRSLNEKSFRSGFSALHAAVIGTQLGWKLSGSKNRSSQRKVEEQVIVKYLLNQKEILVDSTDNFGWTPLFHAVRLGKYTLVETLLQQSASCENVDFVGNNLLHVAYSYGRYKIINLLEGKVDGSALNQKGLTPLQCAGRKLVMAKLKPLCKNRDPLQEEDDQSENDEESKQDEEEDGGSGGGDTASTLRQVAEKIESEENICTEKKTLKEIADEEFEQRKKDRETGAKLASIAKQIE